MGTIEYQSDQKTIQTIVHHYENNQLNLEPGFQRSSVWGDRDRDKLIDSILRNYPLPSIFLYKRYEAGNLVYDVIDGKQRIESLLLFMGVIRGNRFQTRSRLPGQEHQEWLDWTYIKRKKQQHLITAYRLQTIEVTGDLADIIDLFVRINSTGKALTGQEKRHARYFNSEFLKRAGKLAHKYESYLRSSKILSLSQISRMKHIELMCELMVSAHNEDVINKKAALDRVMDSTSISGRQLDKAAQNTVSALNRLKQMFPDLRQTRFRQLSDFYSLTVLIQKFERSRFILTDQRRNRLAWDILVAFSNGVDEVSLLHKKARSIKPEQELYREYMLTVREGTDELNNRRKREQILRGLLETIFESKDSARLFSQEQRRILWNTTAARKCASCGRALTWDDFTIDHIDPYSKGGRTRLDNAALMCRRCNSVKRDRKAA
jgi:5-methylcytosine-specific restriction endonuclease McrA